MEVEMNVILWIIFGAIAGWIASMIMGKDAQMGALANIVVGIVGAVIGGFLMTNVFGAQGVTGFNLPSMLVAIVGDGELFDLAAAGDDLGERECGPAVRGDRLAAVHGRIGDRLEGLRVRAHADLVVVRVGDKEAELTEALDDRHTERRGVGHSLQC